MKRKKVKKKVVEGRGGARPTDDSMGNVIWATRKKLSYLNG